jgi:hypothetical protein
LTDPHCVEKTASSTFPVRRIAANIEQPKLLRAGKPTLRSLNRHLIHKNSQPTVSWRTPLTSMRLGAWPDRRSAFRSPWSVDARTYTTSCRKK